LDNSNNETTFTVFRSSDAGATFAQVGTVTSTAAQTTATGGTVIFNDTTAGLAIDGTYTYYVVANKTTAAFSSANSATAAYTIAAPVLATPGKPTVTGTGTSASVSWIDNSNNENNFVLMRSDNGAPAVAINTQTRTAAQSTATGGTVTFNNTGLVEGHTYTYSVIANRTAVFAGTSASSLTTAYTQPMVAPTFTVTMTRAGGTDTATIRLTDNSAIESGYTVQYTATGGSTGTVTRAAIPGTGTVSTFTITGLIRTNLPTYTFKVNAFNTPLGLTSAQATVTARAQ
jgi:hypothetical protein